MYKPPYKVTSKILKLIAEIQEHLGELKYYSIKKPNIKLRKENKIKTIHHSLAIEGNTLDEEQINTLLDGKSVIGPKKQILEVKNALVLYDQVSKLNPLSENDLLKAHKILMNGLIQSPGQYRHTAVGILKGGEVVRMAPSYKQVPTLMSNLFTYVSKDKTTLALIKACIFHYELEFIHPFQDGNGRMGRLWQQLILMKASPVFEYLPVESLIHKNQKQYYNALEVSDKQGESTTFIEFSLEIILKTLRDNLSGLFSQRPKDHDRIQSAIEHFQDKSFSRKDYMEINKGISTATASRDLALAVQENLLKISGTKSKAIYKAK